MNTASPIRPWHETRDNVNALARHLMSTEVFVTASELQRFHDEPWGWTNEWIAFNEIRAERAMEASA